MLYHISMRYDPFQEKAIEHVDSGHSVVVSAPTGAGKTAIAEYVIRECLTMDRRVIYTAPVKALSNQKYRDFQVPFKDKIGILTGDVSINPHAPVLIMTTEIFRNKVLEEAASLEDYSWVIFDEIHYIDDYERGTVWEESLIFLPEHMKVLALSATIPNIDELAEWFESIHNLPLKVIKEDRRPVPLHFLFQINGKVSDSSSLRGALRKSFGRRSNLRRQRHRPNRPTSLVEHLQNRGRLPCIYFSFGRRRCEHLAHEMTGFDLLTWGEKGKVCALYDKLLAQFDLEGDKSAAGMRPLVEKGIAFHHAGMLPTLKEVVERLFTSRLIKVIFTTETFALGINMPARTVVFDELRKFYGRFYADLRTRDFYQMAGRAGRRGIDEEGFVYSRINPRYTGGNQLKRIIYGRPERVKSRFNASYATVLALYEKHGERLYDIYPRSFHCYQQKEKYRRRALDLLEAKVSILKETGYIDEGGLTPKGSFAAKVYGYEMPLAELYSRGMLNELSEVELGLICLSLVFEPRKGSARPVLSKRARALGRTAEALVNHIHYLEHKFRIKPLSKVCHFHLSPPLEAWIRGEDFDRILRYTDADEGGVIRYFRMAVQILREILDTDAPAGLKEKARVAVRLINRGIVDAKNQLEISEK